MLNSPYPCSHSNNHRIAYFDALKAFAIFLVVFGHIQWFFTHTHESSTITTIVTTFHMPLFMFLSGFFAFKSKKCFTGTFVSKKLISRFKELIIPTIIVLVIYATYCNPDNPVYKLKEFTQDGYLGGYWYTISLFTIFVIYYPLTLIIKNLSSKYTTIILIILFAISICISPNSIINKIIPNLYISDILCLHSTTHNLQFFVFGIAIAKYKELIFNTLKSKWFRDVIVLIFFISSILFSLETENIPPIARVFLIGLIQYSGILLSLFIFNSLSTYFESKSASNNMITFIGRNTLPIYLLQYFFIKKIPGIDWSYLTHNIVIDTLFTSILAFIILGFCILIIKILLYSKFLSKLLYLSN